MGAFRSPWLRPAFEAVDRELFAPRRFWTQERGADGLHPVVDREADVESWRRHVWGAHRSLITQMDDGRTPRCGPSRGDFTSSLSAPDIVFEKLNLLEVEQGNRVLHLGTASGYDTALLCEGAGAGKITSVEVDPALAAWGRANLRNAGYGAESVCGDGLLGHPGSAPFDRILTSASVREIPRSWLAQAAEGCVIVAPFNTRYAAGGLLRLRVASGVGRGRFEGTAWYMWARGHRPVNTVAPLGEPRRSASVISPAEVVDRGHAQDFALGLHVPDIAFDQRGEGEQRQAQFWDDAGTSVALVDHGRWWRPGAVRAWGPRDLWPEVVHAYTRWRTAGRPHFTRYGVTVDTDGHHFWLDEPEQLLGV
ncbi:protein-L-isoaspartate(D-aspartate) O-methyltransferase [Streptomyces sp. XM4193]|uniref:protein-L-isoaspartate O-methyltransferase family protein n=1 Tax=Streptomyces sp. XM4193 TaxID=2929782 RepID=UPI001FF8A333|nr:protein-L-isoaspartate(D-aspartate) O-methyltransferase [Streptomyces sp. XM4193]MCK1796170.1 protein-L-isoaspartate(D-aspartate) O-methyltransferase [Streptomyces sp. XM4193]